MKSSKRCRVCSGKLYSEPLIVFEAMPDVAQFLPTKDELTDDKGTNLEVNQCSSCGLVQLMSEPVDYYREVVRSAAFSSDMREFRITQFSQFINNYQLKSKAAIEIGCGRGEYLQLLSENGLIAHGLEQSVESVQYCLDRGQSVSQGFIDDENYKIADAPFSVFFIFNFLEHLPKPQIVLRGLSNNLDKDAVGLIEVPNFDMILLSGLFSEFIHDHLFYFTSNTLTNLLTTSGFDVLGCEPIWHNYIISAVVKKKDRTDGMLLRKRQMKIKKEVDEFIRSIPSGRVAIWGAGHQALANISLLKLSDVIAYVIDSAPFKQGRFTPATHVPILAPDNLKIAPVDGILVMAAAYSDEVSRILRKDFDPGIKVAILRDHGLEIV